MQLAFRVILCVVECRDIFLSHQRNCNVAIFSVLRGGWIHCIFTAKQDPLCIYSKTGSSVYLQQNRIHCVFQPNRIQCLFTAKQDPLYTYSQTGSTVYLQSNRIHHSQGSTTVCLSGHWPPLIRLNMTCFLEYVDEEK